MNSHELLRNTLDSMDDQIVVIDHSGAIIFVNRPWCESGHHKGCSIDGDWGGINYLELCATSVGMGEGEYGNSALTAIRRVITAEEATAYLEYPSATPSEKRWYRMRVTPLSDDEGGCFLITHRDISDQKGVEQRLQEVSQLDGLTLVANRRTFDQFLDQELRRATRLGTHLSLVRFDIDHFRYLNERYGSAQGDSSLKRVAEVLNSAARRPGDLCARFGADEFALVLGGIRAEDTSALANGVLEAIRRLMIPNEGSSASSWLTISGGIACTIPNSGTTSQTLIEEADERLYQAKSQGRDRVAG